MIELSDNYGGVTELDAPQITGCNNQETGTRKVFPSSAASPLSITLLMITIFCCLTGVSDFSFFGSPILISLLVQILLGYDLCIVSTVLEPIKTDFALCSAQVTSTGSSHTTGMFLTDGASDSAIDRKLTVSEPYAFQSPSFLTTTKLLQFRTSPRDWTQRQPRRSLEVEKTNKSEFKSCPMGQLFVSFISPGAALGSLICGWLADVFGRKLSLLSSCGLIMLGTFLMALSPTLVLLLLGRFILGIAIGMGFVIFSTYITECSPDLWRGRMVSSIEVAQCIGCLSSFAVTAIFGNHHWRWLVGAAGCIAGVQCLGILLLPESPRWYIRKNKPLKAEDSLRRLAGLPKLKRTVGSLRSKDKSLAPVCTREGQSETKNDSENIDESQFGTSLENARIRANELKEVQVKETMDRMIEEFQKEKYYSYDWRQRGKTETEKKTPSTSTDNSSSFPYDLQEILHEKLYRRQSSQTTSGGIPNNNDSRDETYELDSEDNECSLCDFEEAYAKDDQHHSAENTGIRLSPTSVGPDAGDESIELSFSTRDNDSNKDRHCCSLSAQLHHTTRRLSWKRSKTFNECKRHYRQIFIAVGCAVCQNMTASTSILYYSTELLQLGGVKNPFLVGIGIGIAKILGILSVILLVERVGRRNFLLTGSLGVLLCHLGFATCYGVLQSVDTQISPIFIVIAMLVFMFSQNISWAGLMFVVSAEVLPSSVRGIGMALTITTFWVLAFVTQTTFETLMETFSIAGTFLFYGGTTFLALLFTYCWIPDFSGQSLEEITQRFEDRKQKRKKQNNG